MLKTLPVDEKELFPVIVVPSFPEKKLANDPWKIDYNSDSNLQVGTIPYSNIFFFSLYLKTK